MQKNMSGSLGGVIDDMLSGSVAGNIRFESGTGSNVTITPTLESGTKIADFTIDETSGELYAPTPTEYEAGDNVTIENGIISATDTTYTAGDGISIDDGVISADGGGLTYKPAYILFNDGYKYNFIETLLPQLDLEYYIDFYIDSYQNDKAILGNDREASRIHLTMYNNKWYSSGGSGEFNFGDSSMITGRHTFKWNESGTHKILFDDVEVATCNQTVTNDLSIRLNNRNGTMCCAGSRIYEFRITDHSGNIIHQFKPFCIYNGNNLVDKRVIDIAGGMNVGTGYYDIVEIV